MSPKARDFIALVVFLGITFLAAMIGALATNPDSLWYRSLVKPDFSPPDWVFGPVWTTLYILMAIAAWLVWRRSGKIGNAALSLYFTQLVFNSFWSILFFGLHLPGVALLELIGLWLLIAMTTAAFWQIHSLAGLLMLPYLAWVSFAGLINYQIWKLNA